MAPLIEWESLPVGEHRLSCPACGRSPRDKTLGVTVEHDGAGVAHCFRCAHVEAYRPTRPTFVRLAVAPVRAVKLKQERLADNWLRHVQDVANLHAAALDGLEGAARVDRLCELNVIDQARHVCETTVIQDAWARGQVVHVHAWIYGLRDGRISDLGFDSANWLKERIR